MILILKKIHSYKQCFARGLQVGCSPPWKISSGKNLKGGTKVKIYPPPPRFFKKLKWKPQKGYQRIFWLESRKTLKGGLKEIFWTKFRNFSQKCFLWSPLWDFNRISAKIFKKLWFLLKKKILNKILGTSPKIVH